VSGATPPTIRRAVVGDARAIAEVHVEGWRWGYRDILPDALLASLSVDDRERLWVRVLTEPRPERTSCVLAEGSGGAVLGFAACGPADGDFLPPPEGAGEVHALYLREALRGTGVGRALFVEANEALRANDFPTAVLWVFEANDRARRFYEAAGWRTDGARAVHRFEGGERPVVRYVVDLA
jgi:ribosomal protein S18 acetylase RimI-like enzyme